MAVIPVIAIHGGAGTINRSTMTPEKKIEYFTALSAIVAAGQSILSENGSALDAVTEAVRLLEENHLFNAGKGSVFTSKGTHELDASIMDGATLKAGAVAGVTNVRNPILAARAVMEKSEHVMMVGKGAEEFAFQHGLELVDNDFFYDQFRYEQLMQAIKESKGSTLDHDGESDQTTYSADPIDPKNKMGTVGAVAIDINGNLAAATSTGGMTNKLPGRVGDSPIIGAGCYANNSTVAVSSTGTGEMFIRAVAAHDIAALMEYANYSLEDAANHVVFKKLLKIGGRGGVIAIDSQGNVSMPFNTEGMYRGVGYVGKLPEIAIYR